MENLSGQAVQITHHPNAIVQNVGGERHQSLLSLNLNIPRRHAWQERGAGDDAIAQEALWRCSGAEQVTKRMQQWKVRDSYMVIPMVLPGVSGCSSVGEGSWQE